MSADDDLDKDPSRHERSNADDEPPRRRRDDYDERPRRPRRPPPPAVEATDFLIPTGVSGYSMAACYLGLVSCFLPILGLVFAAIAIVCGIVALRRRKKAVTYGAVTGDIRAVIGIILGGLTLLVQVGFVVAAAAGAFAK